jgi:K+-transporting ATPase KdpF subunit
VVPEGLRKDLKGEAPMLIYLTLALVVFLFVYLLVALVRPEWF